MVRTSAFLGVWEYLTCGACRCRDLGDKNVARVGHTSGLSVLGPLICRSLVIITGLGQAFASEAVFPDAVAVMGSVVDGSERMVSERTL